MAKLIDRHIASQVLFLGVSQKTKGGMTSVLVSYDRHIDGMRFIPTWRLGPKAVKAFYMLQAMVRTALLLLLDRRIRIVHIHGAANASFSRCRIFIGMARRFGKKVILHEHAADFKEFYEASADKQSIISVLRSVDLLIALSESWKQFYISIGMPAGKIEVLKNPVTPGQSENAKTAHHPLRALYLGEISRRKGATDLLTALSSGKEFFDGKIEVRFGGNEVDGDIRSEIEAKGLQNTALYMGWVSGSAKTEALEWADIYILPSYNEGLPIAILEAMASGMPVITTPVGGIPELVRDGNNGTLIPPGRSDCIAAALRWYISNPQQVEILGRKALSDVRQYFPPQVFGHLARIYATLLPEPATHSDGRHPNTKADT